MQDQNKAQQAVKNVFEDLTITRANLRDITRLSSFKIMFSEGEQQSILHLLRQIELKAEFMHRMNTATQQE